MKRLLLIGAGHAHAQVLRDWALHPIPGVDVVLVSPTALAPYSGMVPGWLAGTYAFEDICIHFDRLAAAAHARLVLGELTALDTAAQQVQLASGEVLRYDVLSLNTGSTLTPPAVAPPPAVLSLRPLGQLRAAWEQRLAAIVAHPSTDPLRVSAVGGGAAGFESLLAVLARLRALQPHRQITGQLFTRSERLLPGLASGAVRAAERSLARAQVQVQGGVQASTVHWAGSDLLLWATGAEAHAWQRDPQRNGGLAVSEQGFIRIDRALRSCSHPAVYAVGDCAAWAYPLPKAGVYAVRMGPALSRNLRAALGQGSAIAYKPQHRFLALMATGDGSAIGSRGALYAQGRWLWRWKDHIDRRFLRQFNPVSPLTAQSRTGESV